MHQYIGARGIGVSVGSKSALSGSKVGKLMLVIFSIRCRALADYLLFALQSVVHISLDNDYSMWGNIVNVICRYFPPEYIEAKFNT